MTASSAPDPVALAQALIRCASVTPADGGAMAVATAALNDIGFSVIRLDSGTTPNLFASLGSGSPHFMFAGHTDVVPAGNGWSAEPFGGDIRDDILYGRGACDMKGAVAAFIAAAARHVAAAAFQGTISLLLTGDEEGPATDGTVKALQALERLGKIPDFCLVGEPTNPTHLGEMIKVGRRGSMNAKITMRGVQGHVAYPHRADNPVHRLLAALTALTTTTLDNGAEWFEPSSLQVTSIDVGNGAENIIPAEATARLNIRFNTHHSGASLCRWIDEVLRQHAPDFTLETRISGEAFRTEAGEATAKLSSAIERRTGIAPKLDTGGGTSDARFIANYCPVAEFGLVGASMHKADEHVPVRDLRQLTDIYADILKVWFS
jgi:succinyl-diaminopimelate desuccinylase